MQRQSISPEWVEIETFKSPICERTLVEVNEARGKDVLRAPQDMRRGCGQRARDFVN